MNIAISTANLYAMPFPKVLDLYARAGYEYIELAGYWKGGEWEIAQHLKDLRPRDVLRMVRDSGLKISSFHDMGGVIEPGAESVVSDLTHEYLAHAAFPCLVFHAPHRKGADKDWWSGYRETLARDLDGMKANGLVCIENIFPVDNYYMPLIQPEEMRAFAESAGIGVNLDTTHCGQSGVDLLHAADVLGSCVQTVHVSDFGQGRAHVYIGDGTLDLAAFFGRIPMQTLHAITVECALPVDPLDEQVTVEAAREAKRRVEKLAGLRS